MAVVVNGAFWAQRVTGQQRYGHEVSRHLDALGVPILRPPEVWAEPALRAWAWTQTALPRRARQDVLVSLTSRAPVAHRRHVITVHDIVVLTHPEWFSRRYLSVHVPLLKRLLSRAVGVLVVSEPVGDQLRERGLVADSTPVLVAPNAAGQAFTATGGDLALPFLEGIDADGFVLAVGSLEPRKNLARLIRAHASLSLDLRRAYPLVLIGASNAIYAEAALVDGPHVIKAGFVSDEVLASAYRRAAVVVMPSLDEGFGLPLVEAVASGARVLASDIPVFRWVAGEAIEYVDPLSVSDIGRALERMLLDPTARPTAGLPHQFDYQRTARAIAEFAGGLD